MMLFEITILTYLRQGDHFLRTSHVSSDLAVRPAIGMDKILGDTSMRNTRDHRCPN